MIFKIIPELPISSEYFRIIPNSKLHTKYFYFECSARNPSCLSFVSGRRRPTLLSTKTIPTIFPQRISDEYFSGNRSHIHTHTPELLLVQAEQAKQEAVRKLCFVRSACVVRRFGGGGARQGSMSASESWTQASLSSYSSSRFFTDSRPCFGLPLPLLLLLMLLPSSCCCYIQPKRLRL